MEPIKGFASDQYQRALESWSWLDVAEDSSNCLPVRRPLLEGADGWWFLDSIEGKRSLTREWSTGAEMQGCVNTPEGQDRYLLLGLAQAAERRGGTLGPNEVSRWLRHPVLGGPFDAASVTASDFVMALDIAGQIHEEVRSLPPGTRVSRINVT